MIVNILVWALFGLLAGVVARFLFKQPGRSDTLGILVTILLGIAGAVIGGFVASQLFNWDINTFSIAGFGVAVAGAILLLFLYRLMAPAKRSI
jgi:uncharacterized membrane protein YeaQ/YmgE (transglycosylase-associated protein family)